MSMTQNSTLIDPCLELKNELLEMADEFRAAGDERYSTALSDFPNYFEQLLKSAASIDLAPDRVPHNEFWLVDNGKIVARSKLRHYLTPALEIEGGHIGYDVRPSARRKGYGTRILELTLNKAKELGLAKALVTCNADNIGSAKIIKGNSGRFIGQAISRISGKQVFRYEIEI